MWSKVILESWVTSNTGIRSQTNNPIVKLHGDPANITQVQPRARWIRDAYNFQEEAFPLAWNRSSQNLIIMARNLHHHLLSVPQATRAIFQWRDFLISKKGTRKRGKKSPNCLGIKKTMPSRLNLWTATTRGCIRQDMILHPVSLVQIFLNFSTDNYLTHNWC